MPARSTTLPYELEVIETVFKAVVNEPWFHRTATNKYELAEFVFRAYQEGCTDRERLLLYCREAAAVRFSRYD